ncbi:MAG: hypothetical protein DRR00_24630 [Candidatus Parabeggiatoa sp. nov. 3]|nr:MAG: hypothetical protein DRR00_24630 [Gammaproteobacteria bacterium]
MLTIKFKLQTNSSWNVNYYRSSDKYFDPNLTGFQNLSGFKNNYRDKYFGPNLTGFQNLSGFKNNYRDKYFGPNLTGFQNLSGFYYSSTFSKQF